MFTPLFDPPSGPISAAEEAAAHAAFDAELAREALELRGERLLRQAALDAQSAHLGANEVLGRFGHLLRYRSLTLWR